MKANIKMEAEVREERRGYVAGFEDEKGGHKTGNGGKLWKLERQGHAFSSRASKRTSLQAHFRRLTSRALRSSICSIYITYLYA